MSQTVRPNVPMAGNGNALVSGATFRELARLVANIGSETIGISINGMGGLQLDIHGEGNSAAKTLARLMAATRTKRSVVSAATYNRLARLLANMSGDGIGAWVNGMGGLQLELSGMTNPNALKSAAPALREGRAVLGGETYNSIASLLAGIGSETLDIHLNSMGGLQIETRDSGSSQPSPSDSESPSSASGSSSGHSGSSSSSVPVYIPVEVVARATAPTTLTVEYLLCRSYNRSGDPSNPEIYEDPRTTEYTLVMSGGDYQPGDAFAVGFAWTMPQIPPPTPPGPIAVTCCGTYCGTYSISLGDQWRYVALVEIDQEGGIIVTPYGSPSPTPFPT